MNKRAVAGLLGLSLIFSAGALAEENSTNTPASLGVQIPWTPGPTAPKYCWNRSIPNAG